MRCDASRSMRANPITRPHPSRRAHAPASLRNVFGMRAPQDEDEQRVVQNSSYKQPISFPRRIAAPGVCNLASPTPNEGWRSAESRSGAAAPVRRAHNAARQALARRLASLGVGRSPLGAPPWRFFTRGRASVSGIASGSVERAPRSQVVVAWRATSRASRGERLRAAAAGRHASLRLRDRLRRRPSMSEAGKLSSTDTLRSQ